MSLRIYGTKTYFWQWDTGQKLVVDNAECAEVHYCNDTNECALVVLIKTEDDGTRFAEVPNILLQNAKMVSAYLVHQNDDGSETRTRYRFPVLERTRPEDYVYTETEVLNYSNLVRRIDQIEESGVSDEQIATAVEKYLDENPINTGVDFETDHTLTLQDGILSVNTTNDMEQDNTLPITSAGVFATVGNIEVLLKTI